MNMLLMSDSIRKRLQDPFVAGWALRRLENEKGADPLGAERAERFLFDDETIRRLLGLGDRETMTRMFRSLSPERFRGVADSLVDSWPSWDDVLACWSAPVLARVAPEAAAALFREFLASRAFGRDFNKSGGVVKAIGLLHSPAGRELAQMLMPLRVDDGEGLVSPFDVLEAIRLAWTHELPILDDLLIDLVTAPGKVVLANKMLPRVYGALTNGLPFYDHLVDLRAGHTKQTFASLAPLFAPGAPLVELDRLITESPPTDIGNAFVFLCVKCDERDDRCITTIRRFMENRPAPVQHEVKAVMAQFLLGVGAASWLPASGDYSHLSLEDCVRVIASDIRTMPNYDALLSNVRTHPNDHVVAAVLQELATATKHCGTAHLAKLMGDLAFDAFIPPLMGLVEEDSGDILWEETIVALSRFGTDAERVIVDSWSSLDDHQRLWCLGVLENVAGEASIVHLCNVFPEMRKERLEPWCMAAEMAPDTRLLDVLEPELRRKHPVIDTAYVLISAALGEQRKVLAEVRKRVQSARVRQAEQRRSLGPDLAGPSALRMELQCRACGDTNVYEVRNVFVSPEAKSGRPYIGDDFACLSCGERDSLEMASTGFFVLTAELLRIAAAKEGGKEVETPLKLMTGKLADGRLVPVGQSIELYKEAVAKNPDSLVDTLSLANCYDNVGRIRQAEECYRKSLRIDPACPEAAYGLGQILCDSGRRKEAFQIVDAVVGCRERWRFHRLVDATPQEFAEAVLELHEDLAPGPRRTPIAPLRTHFAAVEQKRDRRGKISPNAPCPCGSGKKYKKCCGRIA